jgi:hypothetical protein
MARRTFDPDRIAHFEVAGWRAYYDRHWLRLLRLTLALCQEQFGIPFPRSLAAAYHIVRASIAWVPTDHDLARVAAHLARFYTLAARYAPLTFDPVIVAHAEVVYWEVNRRLSGDRDDPTLLAALVALHGAIFGLTTEEATESAAWRHRALIALDRITGGRDADSDANWEAIEAALRRCYGTVARQLTARQGARTEQRPAKSHDAV